MRNLNDIKRISISWRGAVNIDLERLEEDEIWIDHYSRKVVDEDSLNEQILCYIRDLMMKELVLVDQAFTCGPGEPIWVEAEILETNHGK